jgi:hypothetical protein
LEHEGAWYVPDIESPLNFPVYRMVAPAWTAPNEIVSPENVPVTVPAVMHVDPSISIGPESTCPDCVNCIWNVPDNPSKAVLFQVPVQDPSGVPVAADAGRMASRW